MIPDKGKLIEVLKEVVYFPKGDNIINLKMVDDIEIKENLIRFRLLFEKVDDEKNQILIDTATQMLKGAFGDIEIDIIAASQENALSKVKHIIGVASGKGGVGKSTDKILTFFTFCRCKICFFGKFKNFFFCNICQREPNFF